MYIVDDILRQLLAPIVGAAVAAVAAYLNRKIQAREEAKAEGKIIAAESGAREHPERSKPAWDLARATLEAYFNRNLRQISMIFWLSVFVMIVGFGIICSGIVMSTQTPQSSQAGLITAAAGVLTEFIGATFLFIYRSTIQQAIDYSRTLERINSVGMAMQILDTMPDSISPTDVKSHTKAKLVQTLALAAVAEDDPILPKSSAKRKATKKSTSGNATPETKEA
jgi:nitrate reductase gamma subunit